MILTQRQLDVLNHIVEDGQTWADNAKEASDTAHVVLQMTGGSNNADIQDTSPGSTYFSGALLA
jgi:hypothetical protein